MNRTPAACHSLVPVLLLGGLVSLAAGCELPLHRATETTSEVFSTDTTPKIIVETFNGSIDISNGRDDEVVVEVEKRASGFDADSAERNLANLEVTMRQQDDQIIVRVKRIGTTVGDCGAAVIIAAPPESTVELKTSNGYIVSEGLRAGLTAHTSNARIDVVEAAGRIEIDTSNGPLLIEAEDAQVEAQTSNAPVRFRGTLTGDDNELKTSNGSIDVRLPAESQFRFDASTSNGGVDVEFDFEGETTRRRRHREGTVGDAPAFTLELGTSNASIDIRKED